VQPVVDAGHRHQPVEYPQSSPAPGVAEQRHAVPGANSPARLG
jgi:hypothetical protein